jgi:O-antigen/teichoic acid export membrane protein
VKTHRTGRSIGNFITGLLLQVMSVGIGLFSTPLLLGWLGDERYGAFRSASDWAGYVNLLELGVGGALMALLAQAVGQGDREKVRLTLATGLRVYLQIMAGMVLAGAGIGLFITDLVKVNGAIASELQRGYWLGFLGILLLPLAPFRLLTDASQRSYFTNALLIFQSLLITSLSLLLAWAGFGIPGQYLAVLLGAIAFQGSMCWDGLRHYPDVFKSVANRKVQTNVEQQLWKLNWPTLALRFSGQISVMTDNIIISYSLGAASVVPFFVTQRLAVLAQGQIQGIGNATWAALADLYAKGEREIFNARLIELTKLVAVLGLGFMVAIAAYNPHFVTLWVGQDRFSGNGVTLLAAANGFLLGLISLWDWCFGGTGNVAKLVLPKVLGASVNLVISLIGTKVFGTIGPLLGTFVASLTIGLWWSPLLLHQVFGTSLRQLFFAVAQPLAVGIPYGTVIGWIARNHIPWGWFGLAIEMGLTVLLYLVLAWWTVFSVSEQLEWMSRLRLLLPKITR